jgi:hypothetical protein
MPVNVNGYVPKALSEMNDPIIECLLFEIGSKKLIFEFESFQVNIIAWVHVRAKNPIIFRIFFALRPLK